PKMEHELDVFILTPSRELQNVAKRLAAELREEGYSVVLPLSFEGFSSQLKKAVKHDAHFALLLGEEELKQGLVAVKNLDSKEQKSVPMQELRNFLKNF